MKSGYLQLKNLAHYFDLSPKYFKDRMGKDFIRGVHYYKAPSESATKKPVLWDVDEVDQWLKRNNVVNDKPKTELEELLGRNS